MNILDLQQGSQEWHAVRASHFTASEAPVMMGVSKYQTRNDLLKQKATGLAPEVTEAQQRIFDKGHKAEADARPMAEEIIGMELYPATATSSAVTKLLASFDGIDLMEQLCWEHKLINEKLRHATVDTLEEHYKVQMDQQLLVSGAEKCLFMASDGTANNCNWFWYETTEERKQALLAGWNQFAQDLKDYQPEEVKAEVVAEKPLDLPALVVDLVGEVRSTNLATVKDVILARIESVSTDLVSDQDFADADATVKFFTKGEKQLEEAKQQALSQTASIDELVKTVDHLKDAMRTKRLALNKLVKERKEAIRIEIVLKGKQALADHIAGIESKLGGYRLPVISADFATAIKGKKTVKSLKSAADDELARAKTEANQAAEAIQTNLAIFAEEADEYNFLFADKQQLMTFGADHLKAEISSRIATHKEQERIKAEQERKRIQAEAEAKAQREAEAKAEAERERIRQEERAKAQAEETARQEALAREQKAAKPEQKPVIAEQAQQEVPVTEPEREQPSTQPHFQMPTGRASQAEDTVTITVSEYEQLKQDSATLVALRGAGVDNWDGYDFAMAQLDQAA